MRNRLAAVFATSLTVTALAPALAQASAPGPLKVEKSYGCPLGQGHFVFLPARYEATTCYYGAGDVEPGRAGFRGWNAQQHSGYLRLKDGRQIQFWSGQSGELKPTDHVVGLHLSWR